MRTKNIKFMALTLGTCAAALLCTPIQSAKADSFTPEQVKELESLFTKFLAENPEAILKSVDDYRAEQEEKTQQSAQENLKEYQAYYQDKSLPSMGNPDGDVTIVEYFDYNCGYCRKAFEDLVKIVESDKNIRVVFQEMPILSPSSTTMAVLSLAAHKQGKYFEMHKALMDYRGSQSDEAYHKLAGDIGLDVEKLKTDAASPEIQAAIAKSSEMARNLGIRGTPGFVVGEKIYPGYIGMDGLKGAVEEARAAKVGE